MQLTKEQAETLRTDVSVTLPFAQYLYIMQLLHQQDMELEKCPCPVCKEKGVANGMIAGKIAQSCEQTVGEEKVMETIILVDKMNEVIRKEEAIKNQFNFKGKPKYEA